LKARHSLLLQIFVRAAALLVAGPSALVDNELEAGQSAVLLEAVAGNELVG